jgi:hypothetical protein
MLYHNISEINFGQALEPQRPLAEGRWRTALPSEDLNAETGCRLLRSLVAALPAIAQAQQAVDAHGPMSPKDAPMIAQRRAGARRRHNEPVLPVAGGRAPSDVGGTMRDEYGNMYNSRGDRIDRSGRIIAPPVTPPGARALR